MFLHIKGRITKLVQGAMEVALSLLTIEESVELLAFGAALDSEVYSPALVEVSQLCGRYVKIDFHVPSHTLNLPFVARLPLCLNLASRGMRPS